MTDLLVITQPANSLVYGGSAGGSLTYGGALPQTLQLAAIPPASIEINPIDYQLIAAAEQGPQGIQGPSGPQGIQGPPGPSVLSEDFILDGGNF